MSTKSLAFAVSASFLLASSLAARAHDDEAPGGKLGKVSFPTSCAAAVQPTFERAVAIMEPQCKKHPEHPGVAHYLIHSYDAPPIAQKGLVAARRYAGIAPDAPHALHMPSHIFTRVGSWEESIATNQRSAAVARTAGDWPEAYHASDYAVYAYLQLGRDDAARLTMEEALRFTGGDS